MNETINHRWCSAPGCMLNIKIAKRHFFRFPKERKRWLEWIKACNRMDLVIVGPDYANQYYRLCHLHFRVEMFRNIEGRIYLSKEAVPSIFLKPVQAGDNNSTEMQPISFVTIFLKPESRRSLSSNSSTQLSLTHPIKTDERDTTVISPLQVLFPRASIKIIPSVQTVLKEKSENDNENVLKANSPLIKEASTDLTPTLSRISQEGDDGNILNAEIQLAPLVKETCTDSAIPTLSRISREGKIGNILNAEIQLAPLVKETCTDSAIPTLSRRSREGKIGNIFNAEIQLTPLVKETWTDSAIPISRISREGKDGNIPNAEIQFTPIVKEACTDSAIPTLSRIPRECDNRNIPKEKVKFVQLVKKGCTNSLAAPALSIPPTYDNGDIIDLTSTDDSLMPITSKVVSVPTTMSKVVSVPTTQQNGDKTPKRRRWHISTQTPEAWIYIDSFLKKRRIENSETDVDNQAAKRSKVLCTQNEDYCTKVDQFKAACMDLLPRNYALLVSAFIDTREKRKAKRSSADMQSVLEFFLTASSAYRFYRSLFLLPTVRQLWRHICNWDIPPGLNDNVLNALHLKMKSLPPTERLCCLCVSEMQLRPYLFYNLSRDRIIGFYDNGVEKQWTLARKALVIMARSLVGDWEQPVAYYFYGSTCSANIIKDLIFEAIIKLKSIDMTVHALITGTASIFIRLSRLLGISVEHSSFLVNDERVFYIFDVTRLIKATRNILMSYEIRFRENTASWSDVELLFRRDSESRFRLVPKLTASHLKPSKSQKTETKYAFQVFSNSVATGLRAHIMYDEFPLKALGTMEFVYAFDQLFDILNSSSVSTNCKTNTKDFDQAFTGSMQEMCFLKQTLDFLKSIKVYRDGVYVNTKKSFDHWQITINSVIQLWDTLKKHQIPFLCTRRLNRESIERVFRSIRQQSGNRVKPTPISFTRAFKNLVSKHILEHSSAENSAAKATRMLKRIALLISSSQTDIITPVTTEIALSITATNYRNIDLRLPEKSAFKRVCEFLLSECLRTHVNCETCIDYVAKENTCNKDMPSSFSFYVSCLEDTFMRNFEKLSIEDNLGAQMLQFAQQVEYKPPCPDFPVDFLIKLFLRMRIYFTLSRHNKICKSVESSNSLNVLQL